MTIPILLGQETIWSRSVVDFDYNDLIKRGIRNFNKHYEHYEAEIGKLTFKKRIEQKAKVLFTM